MEDSTRNAEILLNTSREVDLEASMESQDALLLAADELASETPGLKSPLKGSAAKTAPASALKKVASGDFTSTPSLAQTTPLLPKQDLNTSMDTNMRAAINSGAISNSVSKAQTMSATTADEIDIANSANDLLGQMNDSSTGLGKSKIGFRSRRPPRPDNATSSSRNSRNNNMTMGSRMPSSSVTSQQSEVAKFLMNSTDKSYEEKITSNFTSSTQEMLFRTMMKPNVAESKIKKSNKSKKSYGSKSDNEINSSENEVNKTTVRKNNFSKKFAKLDDAKECTFKPAIVKKRQNSEGGDDKKEVEVDGKPKFTFMDRMESKEHGRREKLNERIGKKAYDAILDKKYCPGCGAKQSYDQILNKIKKCEDCGIAYKAKTTWTSVQGNFMKKQLDQASNREKERQKLVEGILKDKLRERYSKFDHKKGELVVDEKAIERELNGARVWTDDIQKEFFDRQENSLEKKVTKMKEVEDKIYQEKYPFKPLIRKKQQDDEDMEDEASGIEEFLRRLEEDLERRRFERMKLNGGKTQKELVAEKTKNKKVWKPSV